MLPANAVAAFTAITWTLGGDEATLGTSPASGQGRNCHCGHVCEFVHLERRATSLRGVGPTAMALTQMPSRGRVVSVQICSLKLLSSSHAPNQSRDGHYTWEKPNFLRFPVPAPGALTQKLLFIVAVQSLSWVWLSEIPWTEILQTPILGPALSHLKTEQEWAQGWCAETRHQHGPGIHPNQAGQRSWKHLRCPWSWKGLLLGSRTEEPAVSWTHRLAGGFSKVPSHWRCLTTLPGCEVILVTGLWKMQLVSLIGSVVSSQWLCSDLSK